MLSNILFEYVLLTTVCPHGAYGKDCSFECTCENGALCEADNGFCNCEPGWTGDSCTERMSVTTGIIDGLIGAITLVHCGLHLFNRLSEWHIWCVL